MALIKCPECGREVSDKASACIHCGCPLDISFDDKEKQYDLILIHHGSAKVSCIKLVRDYLEPDLSRAKKICDSTENGMNPKIYSSTNLSEIEEVGKRFSAIGAKVKIVESGSDESIPNFSFHEDNALRCPRCGSSSVTTGKRGFKLTTGFLGSNKTVNRCGNCGNVWQPK